LEIESRISLVEEILDARKLEMGIDYPGYKNHVYRMIHPEVFEWKMSISSHDNQS
jgi:hypothetical protein